MSTVTELARLALTENVEDHLTPEDVLYYLEDDSNFKLLLDVLKEAMAAAGVCSIGDEQQRFIDELYARLKKQSEDCMDDAITKKTVTRWLNGTTKSIRNRYDAIAICFALQLDNDTASTLLNKCGFNSFNVRNAEDATYLYCTLSGRPLSAAKEILAKYRSCPAEHQEPVSPGQIDHSGSTTNILEEQIIGNSDWDSDDSFLNTFLIPNRNKFIGYATTALTQYYTLKNYLFATVFLRIAWDEMHLVSEYFETNGADVNGMDIPVSLGLRAALRQYGKGTVHPNDNEALPLLRMANGMLDAKLNNTVDVLLRIRDGVLAHEDIKSQIELSQFLSHIMRTEGVLKHAIDSIKSDDGRIRRYTDSSLKASVMKEFPDDKTFAEYERDPGAMGKNMAIRKAIILMYYIAYAYDYSVKLYEDLPYHAGLFERFGFVEFWEDINEVLRKCHLSKMYEANQFDWLILRSIREFQKPDPVYDPIEFFNAVLAYSFGDDPEDEED